MAAYYNEIDPFAAQWLRNLIAAGHIAQGEVDERSIVEVQPDDLRGFTQCHFFAGIGGWSYALRLAGWDDARPVWTGSCPCQPFSVAGKGEGAKDERHLWPYFFRLIRECGPVAVFGEQVASRDALAWLDHVCADLEGAAYTVGAVASPAAGYGAPHIRDRLYWVADAGLPERRPRDGTRGAGGRNVVREREEGTDRTAQRGSIGELADAERRPAERHGYAVGGTPGGSEGAGDQRERLLDDAGDGGYVERMAHDDETGRNRIAPARLHERRAGTLGGESPQGNSDGAFGDDAIRRGEPCPVVVAYACGPGPQEFSGGRDEPARSPTAGFWRHVEWLPCRDGKARPVEPGTFPLAHGIPARVGRLRGYGNAIVAPQAAAFVRAFLEVRP